MRCPHKWCSIGFGIRLVILKKIFSRRSQYNLKTFPETLRIKRWGGRRGKYWPHTPISPTLPPATTSSRCFLQKQNSVPGQVGKKREKLGEMRLVAKRDQVYGDLRKSSAPVRGPGGLDPSSWVITITCYNHRMRQSQHCTQLSQHCTQLCIVQHGYNHPCVPNTWNNCSLWSLSEMSETSTYSTVCIAA